MTVWEQRQYDAPLGGWQASQGRERQPCVAARSILEAPYIPWCVHDKGMYDKNVDGTRAEERVH